MPDTSPIDQLIAQIAAEYDALPRQLKLIAQYVEKNRARLMLVRISEIAADCEVQPSAIVRFAQRFGFSGFSEMQDVFRLHYSEQSGAAPDYQQRIRKLIATRDGGVTAGDITRELAGVSRAGLDSLAEGLDDAQMEAAVGLLQHAPNIYIIGVRRSFAVAAYLAYALEHTDKRVHLVSGIGGMQRQQIKSAREGDVVIAISFAPYGKETLQCAKLALDKGARLLAITDSSLAPLARSADVVLTVTEGNAYAFRSLASTMCLCQGLFIALAYKLELDIGDGSHPADED